MSDISALGIQLSSDISARRTREFCVSSVRLTNDEMLADVHAVPMQFEPLELHVIDALGQQEVPDYFNNLQRPSLRM